MDAEANEWIVNHPAVIFYAAFLFVGSLASLYYLLRKETLANRLGKLPLSPWKIDPINFALFIVSLILWGIISGPVFVKICSLFLGKEFEPGTLSIILAGLILQLGILYIFLRFRFHFRTIEERPLNENPHTFKQSLGMGFVYFLASLPIITTVGVAWNGFIELLNQFGFNINLPIQETITLFQDAENFVELIGLLVLAVFVAPLVEECVFRGGIYRFFRGRFGIFVSMMISGLIFGIVHGNMQSLPGLVAVGACLAFAYENSKNIKVPIIFHALFNLNSIIWILILPQNIV